MFLVEYRAMISTCESRILPSSNPYLTQSRDALVSAPVSLGSSIVPVQHQGPCTAWAVLLHNFWVWNLSKCSMTTVFLNLNTAFSLYVNYYSVICSTKSWLPGLLDILEWLWSLFFGFPVFFSTEEADIWLMFSALLVLSSSGATRSFQLYLHFDIKGNFWFKT